LRATGHGDGGSARIGPGGPPAAPILRRVKDLQGYTIGAADGDIGDVRDFYYGHPFYWVGPYRWGPVAAPTTDPAAYVPPRGGAVPPPEAREADDPHLRSTGEVAGYVIQATDGRLGHVVDFLVEEESWAIRYLIVDPRTWWPGKHVLIAAEWLSGVSWDRSQVSVDLSREQVRSAPEYDPAAAIDRDWEARLFSSYGRPPYWERRPEAWFRHPPAA
jgi:hypothetical protein